MKYIKSYKDRKFKKYIIVDFDKQDNKSDNKRDRYYILRISKITDSDIYYDKFYYIEDDKLVTLDYESSYGNLNIIYQYNTEAAAIRTLNTLYYALKYNL